jgi:hypothetical protein
VRSVTRDAFQNFQNAPFIGGFEFSAVPKVGDSGGGLTIKLEVKNE